MSAVTDLEERGRQAGQTATRAIGRSFARGLLVTGAWYWSSIILTAVVMAVIQSRTGGLDGGSLQFTLGSTRWFMFTLGMILVTAMLPLHLAGGGTRRSFVRGLIKAAVLAGTAFGLVAAVLLQAERLVWGGLGLEWFTRQGLEPGNFVVTTLSDALVVATYVLVGALLPAGFLRFGAWGGSFMIAALLAVAFFADWSVHTGYIFGWEPLVGTGTARTVLGLGGGLLAVLVTAFGVDRLYRGVPLRPSIT